MHAPPNTALGRLALQIRAVGLPADGYGADYGRGGEDDRPAFGARRRGGSPPPRPPDWRSPAAVAAYLAEVWVRAARDAGNQGRVVELVAARIRRAARNPTPQGAAADCSSLGPPVTAPGAAAYYRAVAEAQAAIRAATGAPPVRSNPGEVAATASAAVGRAARAAASQPGRIAADVRAQAAALAASAERAAATAAAAPVGVATAAASVPKHLASEVGETARDYLATVREVAPQLAGAVTDVAKEAGESAWSLGLGVGTGGGVVALGVGVAALLGLAIYASPEIGAAYAASTAAGAGNGRR